MLVGPSPGVTLDAELVDLEAGRRWPVEAPGFGFTFDGAPRALESLHELRDLAWAVYQSGTGWSLHVAAGVLLRLDGRVTGGGEVVTGDVLDDGDQLFRFLCEPWPGPRNAALDERTKAAPRDDGLALVYRDWLLERRGPLAEALRRPVPRAEQARHLFPFAAELADGTMELEFAGPAPHRLVVRAPDLDIERFVTRLARGCSAVPSLERLRVIGLEADVVRGLADTLVHTPGCRQLHALERDPTESVFFSDLREGSSWRPSDRPRHLALELISWDGWTSLEPLTSKANASAGHAVTIDADLSLEVNDGAAALVPRREGATVDLLRRAALIIRVASSTPAELRPRWRGQPMPPLLALTGGDEFELVPGVSCRLRFTAP